MQPSSSNRVFKTREGDSTALYQGVLAFGAVVYPIWGLINAWIDRSMPERLPLRLGISLLAALTLVAHRRNWIRPKHFLTLVTGFQWAVVLSGTARLLSGANWTGATPAPFLLTLMCIAATCVSFRTFVAYAVYSTVLPLVLNALFFHHPLSHFREVVPSVATMLGIFSIALWHQFRSSTQLEAQNQAMRLYQFSLEHSYDFCIWVKPDGTTLKANRSFRETFGDGTRIMSVFDINPGLTPELWREHWDRLRKSQTFQRETSLRRPDGSLIPVHMTADWLSIDGEEISCIFIRDLTEQKALEAKAEEQRSQLQHASKLTAVGEMAGGIAHEINNPLAIITAKATMIRMLLETPVLDSSKVKRELDGIENTVQRIVRIIRNLNSLSRNSQGDPLETTTVKAILGDTLLLCKERFQAHGARLIVDDQSSEALIRCRPSQIAQILLNLLNNALDAVAELPTEGSGTPPDRWVRLTTCSYPGRVEIRVEDAGKGIPAAVAERIMQPFFTTKAPGKGTGLGLSISRKIAEDHGGSLVLDRASEQTRFVLVLPLEASESRKAA